MRLAELRAAPDTPPPRRRRHLIVGGALLLVLAVLVVVGFDALNRPRVPAVTPRQAVPVALAPATPPVAPPTGPGPTDTDLTIPTTTPAGLTWSLVAGEWEPTSPTAGPAHVRGAIAAGYARTPLGALIAAQQISTRIGIAPHYGWKDVILAQVVPSSTRDKWIALRSTTTDDPPTGGWQQPVGFRYVTWTPDQAVLQSLVHGVNDTDFQSVTTTLQWRDGDWRLLLDSPDGSPIPPAFRVPSPTGFVLWGAPSA